MDDWRQIVAETLEHAIEMYHRGQPASLQTAMIETDRALTAVFEHFLREGGEPLPRLSEAGSHYQLIDQFAAKVGADADDIFYLKYVYRPIRNRTKTALTPVASVVGGFIELTVRWLRLAGFTPYELSLKLEPAATRPGFSDIPPLEWLDDAQRGGAFLKEPCTIDAFGACAAYRDVMTLLFRGKHGDAIEADRIARQQFGELYSVPADPRFKSDIDTVRGWRESSREKGEAESWSRTTDAFEVFGRYLEQVASDIPPLEWMVGWLDKAERGGAFLEEPRTIDAFGACAAYRNVVALLFRGRDDDAIEADRIARQQFGKLYGVPADPRFKSDIDTVRGWRASLREKGEVARWPRSFDAFEAFGRYLEQAASDRNN